MNSTFRFDAPLQEKKTWPIEKLAALPDDELEKIIGKNIKKQNQLGDHFQTSSNEDEKKRAFFWYSKSAAQEDCEGEMKLGLCFLHGTGIPQDKKQGYYLLLTAAEKNYPDAQYYLSLSHKNNKDPASRKAAFHWCNEAASNKHIPAMRLLGDFYMEGIGVKKNLVKAYEWYSTAAHLENIDAQYKLGLMYLDGQGTTKDEREGVTWLKRAADKRHKEAQYELARCYEWGRGVTCDEAQALMWFHKSASQGHSIACYQMGTYYKQGKLLEKNDDEAAQWFQKAAALKYGPACAWVEGHLDAGPDFILDEVKTSKDYFIPRELPPPFSQIGPYCGLAALAAALNYSGCLSFPVYATEYEKKQAGKDINIKDDILLYQLQHTLKGKIKEKWHTKEGEIFNVKLFKLLAEHYGVENCEARVPSKDCRKKQYRTGLFNALKNNYVLVVACGSKDEMPYRGDAENSHWVMVPAYWYDANNKPMVNAMHHGIYAKWEVSGPKGLGESNRQMPIQNVVSPDCHLKKFRGSFFAVPVVKPREILRSEMPEDNINIESDDEKMQANPLELFKYEYEKQRQSELFSNPFSTMTKNISSFTTIEEVIDYAEKHPGSRTDKVLRKTGA